jgi:hypothetical protein
LTPRPAVTIDRPVVMQVPSFPSTAAGVSPSTLTPRRQAGRLVDAGGNLDAHPTVADDQHDDDQAGRHDRRARGHAGPELPFHVGRGENRGGKPVAWSMPAATPHFPRNDRPGGRSAEW